MGDKKRQAGKRYFTSELFYHGMILPGMIFVLLFNFVPMFGIVMAFQDYKPAKGFFGSAFVGMKHFKYLFEIPEHTGYRVGEDCAGHHYGNHFFYPAQ